MRYQRFYGKNKNKCLFNIEETCRYMYMGRVYNFNFITVKKMHRIQHI